MEVTDYITEKRNFAARAETPNQKCHENFPDISIM